MHHIAPAPHIHCRVHSCAPYQQLRGDRIDQIGQRHVDGVTAVKMEKLHQGVLHLQPAHFRKAGDSRPHTDDTRIIRQGEGSGALPCERVIFFIRTKIKGLRPFAYHPASRIAHLHPAAVLIGMRHAVVNYPHARENGGAAPQRVNGEKYAYGAQIKCLVDI